MVFCNSSSSSSSNGSDLVMMSAGFEYMVSSFFALEKKSSIYGQKSFLLLFLPNSTIQVVL